jgi:hypothetical protein
MFYSGTKFCLNFIFFLLGVGFAYAQGDVLDDRKSEFKRLTFYDYRGTNSIDLAFGTSVPNGDLLEPQFEIYFKGGYKRHFAEHFNLGVSYSKYNIAFKDIYNQGFMSFDINLEYLMLPYNKFTPFIYAGYGYNAANYFESTSSKVQGAAGMEYIFADRFGLRLFAEYNYAFSDELDGLIAGSGDDTFFRTGLGLHMYFGGRKKKERIRKKLKTVINSNLIVPYNK